MPAPGGAADKLGNRYEGLWAIDQLLRVVEGGVVQVVFEPLDAEESLGIEFRVSLPNGGSEYWSIKRQTTKAAAWTLSILSAKDENGRSILADLVGHVQRDPRNHGVFASTVGAYELQELHEYSADRNVFESRLGLSAKLCGAFEETLLPLCGGDRDAARKIVGRIRTHATDERQLRERIDFAIRQFFYRLDGIPVDVVAIRGHLIELILDHIHRPVTGGDILAKVESHGFHRREWAADRTIRDRLAELRTAYLNPLRSQMIGGIRIDLPSDGAIIGPEGTPVRRRVLVVGEAGSGKSSTLAGVIEQLVRGGVPTLPVRFDQLPEGILTTTELGRKLGLPESPAMVLAAAANGGPCALVIDQLDAISFTSGRRTELWSLFESLLHEADRLPGLFLIAGCRGFDLEHDHRLRGLKRDSAGFAVVQLNPLSPEQVDVALHAGGVDPAALAPTFRAILALPLNLAMYLALTPASRGGVWTREDLFDHFWIEKERQADKRLGRKAAWTAVIDKLAGWLSDHQQLSAPEFAMDDLAADAAVMVSEGVLIKSDGRYRFFHESFFDYAFARRFAAANRSIVELLVGTPQHLFRRAQIRQVLSFLRQHARARYLTELKSLLIHKDVRFHIKRSVFQWLSSLADPTVDEWRVLQEFQSAFPDASSHVRSVVANQPAWFDVLDSTGFFSGALASNDAKRSEEAIWMLGRNRIIEARSPRVAIGHWFDRIVARWRNPSPADIGASEEDGNAAARARIARLRNSLDSAGRSEHVIRDTALAAPHRFVVEFLPRVADFARQEAMAEENHLDTDPLWSLRHYGDDTYSPADAILVGLAASLEKLASTDPATLNAMLDQYVDRSDDVIAYLTLRAWTAAPEVYADRIIEYLLADPRRLRIGYCSYSGSGGSASILRSRNAVRVATAISTSPKLAELEHVIVDMKVDWELAHPQSRGRTQLELLECFDYSKLGPRGLAKLDELRTKFPDFAVCDPKAVSFGFVGSPIPNDAVAKMNDDQWLRAMQKYKGVEHTRHRNGELAGGERQLAQTLEQAAKEEPTRFAVMAHRMADDLPPSYFDSLLRGIASSWDHKSGNPAPLAPADAMKLISRVHVLPNRPCGASIAWIIEKWRGYDWPDEILEIVSWYAINDPDPDKEEWKTKSGSGQCYHNGNPHHAGINSTRGLIAGAIATLLFDRQQRFPSLEMVVGSLARDPSTAVRACAAEALLAVLNVDSPKAIAWFNVLVQTDAAILSTPYVERFVYYAGFRDYSAIRPVIQSMLASPDEAVVAAAARAVILLAFTIEAAAEDAGRVRTGTAVMRKAAADIYSTNIAHEEVGPEARRRVKPFLIDPDGEVRTESASLFRSISQLETADQEDMLAAFLSANPSPAALEEVIRALEDSPVQLPALVSRLAELAVDAFRDDAGDITKSGAAVGGDLSKIVVRLYAQASEPTIQSRCLDLIDRMEFHYFYGLSDELRQLDR